MLVVLKTEAQTSVLGVADSLYAVGNYSKAIESYNTHNNPAEVFERIAKSYVALGNYDEALSYYAKALKAHPENVFLKFDYAKLLSNTKKYKEAAFLFEELIYKDNTNPNYHYEAGLVLEAMQDSTAINQFRMTYDLDNTHQKAIYKIAREFLVDRKHDVSLKYINIGLQSYANNVELMSLKAQNYYWLEDYRESAKWFEKMIELGESSQFIHEKLAFCYARHYQYSQAIEQGKLALKYDPKNFNNLFIQGQMYEGLQDYENAAKYMALALEIRDVPLDDEYRRLGYVYNLQEKYKEGIDAMNKSLKINPNNELAKFQLLNAKDRYYKDVDTRIALFEQFKEKNANSPYIYWVERRLKELKEEKFIKAED